MSASIKRRSGATPSGQNAHRSKLETKDVLQLKSAATTRTDNTITDQIDDASVVGSEFSTGKVLYENTCSLKIVSANISTFLAGIFASGKRL